MTMVKPSVATGSVLENRLDQLYNRRFPEATRQRRDAVWKVLCRNWLDRYSAPEARVLEVAAGYCEFINNIQAGERVAVDLNPDARKFAAPSVAVHLTEAVNLADVLPHDSFDLAFTSNFLEHCRSRDQILKVLHAVKMVLKPGGQFLILGPNFKYCARTYFDFFDHHIPLTENSVVEALELSGFVAETVEPRTLPFTFNGRLPSWPWLVRAYLLMRFAWPIFGAQFFITARKPA
jgi:SAM-dependent methyltransferase